MCLGKYTPFVGLAFLLLSVIGCEKSGKSEKQGQAGGGAAAPTLFALLPVETTNVTFNNALTETPFANIMAYQYFYNGGGVAVGDLNQDGLQDIYFSGNLVPNQLYLNKGKMNFQDVTAAAGVAGRPNTWKTGVTIADVNGDGLPDIYQCYSGHMPGSARVNQLFINQGAGANGVPVFTDKAAEMGLADSAYSTHAVFFDYDRDQDLDLFLLNHNPVQFVNLDAVTIQEILKKPEPNKQAKLYQNNNGVFKEVSDKAGLHKSAFSYGLGAGVSDINQDGWPDIYVSNDYSAPDRLLINNRNGTFSDASKPALQHTPIYSMGNDLADINNDGLTDIMALDMLPEDNKRQKLLFGPDNYEYFDLLVKAGFNYQYMRNMLQVNNGNGTFSEIGQLSGISNTDWSWAPLVADYDNDGWKDLFISNGFLRDFTNMDFIKFRSSYFQYLRGKVTPESLMNLLSKMPASNVNNYMFRNNGNLQFSNMGQDWGFNVPSNSNGAAYADFDNDGDLDLVTNNVNQAAFIYLNQSEKQLKNRYLQVKLAGAGLNTQGLGAKITLYHQGQQQFQEQMTSRGYQSTVSPVLHFGVGTLTAVDSVRVVWQSGKQEVLTRVATNQVLALEEKNAAATYVAPAFEKPLFSPTAPPFSFAHQKTNINDFKRQPLMVSPMSFSGPCMVKADVNRDGLEDLFVGGGAGQAGVLYLQNRNGQFTAKPSPALATDKASDDVDALFFDANKDGTPDLYVVSGGYHQFTPDDAALQDRLYLNDGKGNFTKAPAGALPAMRTSTSCARAADVNGDGALDLFVGGRVVPGRYPEIPRSYVLLNNGKGQFTDQTATVAPKLQQIGMVTDAAWHDLDQNGTLELLLVGEWMPLTVYSLKNGKLTETTNAFFNRKYSGWWTKLLVADFNGDKRPDLLVGNQGLNTQCKASDKEPAELYYKDFDDNGAVDPILCFYVQGKSYPYVTRDELLDQVSMMRTRFQDYASYANAGIENIFTPEELKGAGRLSSNYLQTAYFQGSATGTFKETPLPLQAQYAPVFALATLDANRDGAPDVLLGGNVNKARLRFGKSDANYGMLLQNDGKGNFTYVPQQRSGFKVYGDVRSIMPLKNTVLFGINQMPLTAYKLP